MCVFDSDNVDVMYTGYNSHLLMLGLCLQLTKKKAVFRTKATTPMMQRIITMHPEAANRKQTLDNNRLQHASGEASYLLLKP